MLSTLVGNLVRNQLQRLGYYLAQTRLTPNAFTLIGLLLNVIVAAIIASGNLLVGGIMALVAGAFDMLDGAVARSTGQVTKFGGFFDSTLDRYSEAIVYFGLLIYLMNTDAGTTAVALLFAAIIGSLMVSYSRARAEAAGVDAEVGIFARPERIILLAILLMFNQPVIALWILAIVTNFTTMQRIFHVWRETRYGSE
ncbi:MAG: CDP-alcohol phosphatidyltransferase family protein [Sphaerobacteraceae bacterium]|nr:MAG: CDP-alcohol phosphatidyltransferase family protein [Sphaerobacteraceae bacterium]